MKKTTYQLLLVFLLCWQGAIVSAQEIKLIPESAIETLQNDLSEAGESSSKTAMRRACKKISRSGISLLKKYPDAENKYVVLALLFATQKELIVMDNSDRNRAAFFKTCEELVKAPDFYAKERLAADVLLSQRALAAKTVTVDERALSIAQLADRYKNTDAEAESLMICSLFALDISNRFLLDAFVEVLSQRFGSQPTVVTFLREQLGSTNDSRFAGNFKKLDGTELNFMPGRFFLAIHWSKDMDFLKVRISEISMLQKAYPGQFEVYSFNVDGLEDGGAKILKNMGADFTVMKIAPQEQKLFKLSVIDEYGWSRGEVRANHNHREQALRSKVQGAMRNQQLWPLMSSLRTGDFLINDPLGKVDFTMPPELKTFSSTTGAFTGTKLKPNANSVPEETLQAIQDAFIQAPKRYNLALKETIAMYSSIDALCSAALEKHSKADNLWLVHNRRIIALLGLWRQTRKGLHLKEACKSSKVILAMKLPMSAQIVSRFCLATQDLSDNNTPPDKLLATFMEGVGDKAPGSAYAAALLLSFDSQSRPNYTKYRDLLLDEYSNDPSSWGVSSFLLDPTSSAKLFETGLGGKKSQRKNKSLSRIFKADFLKGKMSKRTTTVVFSEAYSGKDKKVEQLQQQVFNFVSKNSSIVPVFPLRDQAKVEAMFKKQRWTFKPVFLDTDQWQLMTRQWGLFSTNIKPNIFVLRPDSSILCNVSAISPDLVRHETATHRLGTDYRNYYLPLADEALFTGNYQIYLQEVNASFPVKSTKRSRHSSAHEEVEAKHRQKQIWTYIQLKDWKKALESVNHNLDIHAKPPSNKYHKYCYGCSRQVTCLAIKLKTLKALGKTDEAKEVEAMIKAAVCPPGNPVINDKAWRMPNEPAARLAFMNEYMRTNQGRSGNWLRKTIMISSLMMRAQIYDATGQAAKAKFDRERAEAQSWPHPPKQFDPRTDIVAAAHRRKVIAKHIKSKLWQKALDLTNANITNHEADAVRRKQHCVDCAYHVIAFGKRTEYLQKLKWTEADTLNTAMIKAGVCPTGTTAKPIAHFPINYFYSRSRKGDKGKIEFVKDYLEKGAGGVAPHKRRLSLGKDLILRAKIFEALGKKEQAEQDNFRAQAVSYPGTGVVIDESQGAIMKYVDLLEAEVTKKE